ncbi:MAG TPA: bacteriohemerythrin [Azospirillaceae bacterium]|nr:bacteriohemerythrin [Azospirillaceae bacterium]
MEWNDAYSIDHGSVDDDHMHLFRLFNDFSRAVRDDKAEPAVKPFLDELMNYTKYHFAREEALMARMKYPDLPSHQESHQRFITQVDVIIADYRAGKKVEGFLLDFVMTWLSGHILIIDKRVSDFIGEQQGASQA